MSYHENILSLIGNTPLVKLNHVVEPGSATVLAKLEHLNPAGSVKDRMAVHMINKAEEEGLLKPGATIVESTSGNTGLGLAMVAAVRGYRAIFTMPDKMSQEKIDMLKAYGAEVIVTPTNVSHDSPEGYVAVAKRIASKTRDSFYTDQYYNMHNPEAHYLTTGPELWEQTEGKIDCFVCSLGTGGTVSGTAKYLKEQAKKAGKEVSVVCGDPIGSIYADTFYGREVREPKVYKVEGIGHDWMVGTLDFSVVDEVREVSDRESFLAARRLAREEGIFCGGSTGTLIHTAVEVAKELGPDKLVVVTTCDSGDRYISKFYNDEWMKDLGFLALHDRIGSVKELLDFKQGTVVFAKADEKISEVASRMSKKGISQMPVTGYGARPHMMVDEVDLLQSLVTGECQPDDLVVKAARPLKGQVSPRDSVSALETIFNDNNVAVVIENDEIIGIISKIDVVKFLASRT